MDPLPVGESKYDQDGKKSLDGEGRRTSPSPWTEVSEDSERVGVGVKGLQLTVGYLFLAELPGVDRELVMVNG